ncbi:50S ribosomal protein L10 [Vulcanisaeta thermophila]|uniref:50S ribosomal protein L10 n=1 Tax=Vulcanisaeta thermophila TaxID=867917 RepID=UPI000853D24A|nr:50S ribosomal protein L10 [Vulcanisaeta thermophila]
MGQVFRRSYVRTKPYPEKKVRIVNELKELFSKYESLFVIDLHGTPNRIIQEYRFWLRRRGARVIKTKNTLALLALKQLVGDVPEEIEKVFTGENLFIFTNENPFEFTRWIEENGVRREARPGDIAPFELVVPAGNTGMSPGPIMSKFGKLKIPIRVQDGKIWIVKDTVVARPGDKITEDVADILSKLKVKPIFETLRVKAVVYKMRRLIQTSELKLDIKQYRSDFENAVRYAFNLALNTVYPTPEVLRISISRAYTEAMNLAVNAGFIIPETAQQIIAKAVAQANALASVIAPRAPQLNLQVTTQVAPQPQAPTEAKGGEEKKAEEKKEGGEEERKEGPSEEEIAAGFASLFG